MKPQAPRKRLAIFAHFDAENEVKPSIVHYMRHLRAECDRVVFVSTSALPPREVDKLGQHCAEVILRENVGFDFAMWQDAIRRVELGAWDELVLANSSVLGPVRPLGDVFRRMAGSPCDFWGITQSKEYCDHLQSYFLVFRARVLHSETFRAFFDAVLPFTDKQQVIYSYELSLTHWFEEQGFSWEAAFPYSLFEKGLFARHREPVNPSLYFADELLRLGDPFLKVDVLRRKLRGVPVRAALRALAATGYGAELLEYDRLRPKWP